MNLIERDGNISFLESKLESVGSGEGHCVLITGEAGIGKTSVVRAFSRIAKNKSRVFIGSCDALSTPRPLAPLYDVIWQMGLQHAKDNDRNTMFTSILETAAKSELTAVIIFEDVHWADEATLDFIKFFVRRIALTNCLFILTCRDDELQATAMVRNIFGQMPADVFSRIELSPLSRRAVEVLAQQRGYKGQDVYNISLGNPFYVTEILASYSTGIPVNIKDAILDVYSRQDDQTKSLWQLVSVAPSGVALNFFESVRDEFARALEQSLASGILQINNNAVVFKHELYRRTIEGALSPLLRIQLNKQILQFLMQASGAEQRLQLIVHHATQAQDHSVVMQYAPVAAEAAAKVNAHIEAASLYLTAIEFGSNSDLEIQVNLFEKYAYECYLTNQIEKAIQYQEKALLVWKSRNNVLKAGAALRFLSRLSWYNGNRQNALHYGMEAIAMLESEPPSSTKAMALSNLSQLYMLSYNASECLQWGEKAINMAKEIGDTETLCHALNNVGTMQCHNAATEEKGLGLLKESLRIALAHNYNEHGARAYTNLINTFLVTNKYVLVKEILDEGIRFCEERDLDSWTSYMLADKAKCFLETNNSPEAYNIASKLLAYEEQAYIVKIGAMAVMATAMLRNKQEQATALLMQAHELAMNSAELQRIIPVLSAMLEYEWLTGNMIVPQNSIDIAAKMCESGGTIPQNARLSFWLDLARGQHIQLREEYAAYKFDTKTNVEHAAKFWEGEGCLYMQAIILFQGTEINKREAISIIQHCNAPATHEKMKALMRKAGMTRIPRGVRKTTKANAALLTTREMEVLHLIRDGLQNKEIAARLFISAKTVDHHISSILLKIGAASRAKAVQEAVRQKII